MDKESKKSTLAHSKSIDFVLESAPLKIKKENARNESRNSQKLWLTRSNNC
jgi:hypothetical protein